MRVPVLALVVLLGLSPAAAAEPQRLIVPTLLGEYHLLFDDRRVTEGELRALVVLSPHLAGWTSLAVAPRLERCVVGDPAYLDCGNRSVRSDTFLWRECAAVLGEVARATSPDAQFAMVALPWHNCANAPFRRRLGDYPMAAWQRFLSGWRITERLVEMLPREVERR